MWIAVLITFIGFHRATGRVSVNQKGKFRLPDVPWPRLHEGTQPISTVTSRQIRVLLGAVLLSSTCSHLPDTLIIC
jgi:hypothetical protein